MTDTTSGSHMYEEQPCIMVRAFARGKNATEVTSGDNLESFVHQSSCAVPLPRTSNICTTCMPKTPIVTVYLGFKALRHMWASRIVIGHVQLSIPLVQYQQNAEAPIPG